MGVAGIHAIFLFMEMLEFGRREVIFSSMASHSARLRYQTKLIYLFYDLLRQLMLLQERNKDSQSTYCEL